VSIAKKQPAWTYETATGAVACWANTRSEARAALKKRLGLKRLPAGTRPERAGPRAMTADH
jgi:hypothetical protein